MLCSSLTYRLLAAATLTVCLGLTPAAAERKLGVGVDLGTLGFGVQGSYEINDQWGVELGFRGAQFDYDVEADDNNGIDGDELNHDGDLDLRTINLLGHYRPFSGRFRLVGGALFNITDIENRSRCDNLVGCELGDGFFQPLVLGTVTTRFDVNTLAPYLGVGWSAPASSRGRIFWALDLGLTYFGEVDASIDSDGLCESVPACAAELEREERELDDDADQFPVYPVLAFGLRIALD